MQVTTIQGIVENGQIKFSETVDLPEKTVVYLVVPNLEKIPTAKIVSPRLVNKADAKKFIKKVEADVDDEV